MISPNMTLLLWIERTEQEFHEAELRRLGLEKLGHNNFK